MTKALFKKQMMEVFSWLYKDRKSGNLRSAKSIAVYLYFIFSSLVFWVLFFMAQPICCANR